MARLRCRDHGFDCDFEVEGDDISKVIERFGNHTLIKHGKKYEKRISDAFTSWGHMFMSIL